MGQRVDLGVSPTGVQHAVEIDHDGNSLTAIEYTPTHIESAILTENAELRTIPQSGGGLRHAAKVPILTHHMWKQEWRKKYSGDVTWPTFLAMKLNSPEYEKLRTGYKRGGSMKL